MRNSRARQNMVQQQNGSVASLSASCSRKRMPRDDARSTSERHRAGRCEGRSLLIGHCEAALSRLYLSRSQLGPSARISRLVTAALRSGAACGWCAGCAVRFLTRRASPVGNNRHIDYNPHVTDRGCGSRRGDPPAWPAIARRCCNASRPVYLYRVCRRDQPRRRRSGEGGRARFNIHTQIHRSLGSFAHERERVGVPYVEARAAESAATECSHRASVLRSVPGPRSYRPAARRPCDVVHEDQIRCTMDPTSGTPPSSLGRRVATAWPGPSKQAQ